MSIFNGRPNGGIVKSKGQLLKEAVIKIADLENEKRELAKERQWLSERVSYLVVMVSAIGQHSGLSPQEAAEVTKKFIAEKEVDMNEQLEVAKSKFKENIANGIMPENFTIKNAAGNIETFPGKA